MRSRRSLIIVLSVGFFASHSGMLLGLLSGYAVALLFAKSTTTTALVAMAIGILLLTAVLTLFSRVECYELLKMGPEARSGEFRRSAWRRVAEVYGLSPREQEVMELLAAGRNSSCIEQQLYISRSTVKTHRRHIYEKTGVGSTQELIDLIEKSSV